MEKTTFKHFVNPGDNIRELSLRAVLTGVIMAMFMGAAAAYVGLKAGMTIAATYTAAVIGMAIIKAFKGTLLEENCARTVGSIGGNISSGAIFTLPAFFIAGIWQPFFTVEHYIISTVILVVGGILGIMFVTITRRILVSNTELPFPESIAAAEIHKAGQKGAVGSKYLLSGVGMGAVYTILTELKIIGLNWQKLFSLDKGAILLRGPEMSPAFVGVGYIIGPRLAAVNFSGGLLAWGLLAPAIAFFLHYNNLGAVTNWADEINLIWKNYVRYIAIGGMLVGAFYTLFRMRKNLVEGISRSLSNLFRRKSMAAETMIRTEKDIDIKWSFMAIILIAVIVFFIFNRFANDITASIIAAIVMLIFGFVFAAVSGYLVGIIGVSSNPTSGLTVTVLIAVAFLMVLLGLGGESGIAAVLGIAAFTCVSVSVAGEMMQDLKAGHILGCTPWRMQFGDIFGVTAAALVMFLVLSVLHLGDIKQAVSEKLTTYEEKNIQQVEYSGNYRGLQKKAYTLDEIKKLHPEQQNEILQTNAGFGGEKIAAPQASLMAVVSRSIIQKKTEWILILVGMLMGLGFIAMGIGSPMLVSVGMYLPIDTSFAIFLGGIFKAIIDHYTKKRELAAEAKETISNRGILMASGLIAGEAFMGIIFAILAFAQIKLPKIFTDPSYLVSFLLILIVGAILVIFPIKRIKTQSR